MKKFVGKENPDILVHGGRTEALKQMRIAAKKQQHMANICLYLAPPFPSKATLFQVV